MNDESIMTHKLPSVAKPAKKHILKLFPQLIVCNVQSSQDSLDRWLEADKTGGKEGIKMWLTELKMMFPNDIKDTYDIPQIEPPLTAEEIGQLMGGN